MSEKMITLYKYVTCEHLEDILKNQRLLLSDGTNFNDPFELKVINSRTRSVTTVNGLHILCLTNSYRKKLMWSYYSDSHKGACLTIEVPRKLVYPMCYTSCRVYENSDLDDIISHSQKSSKRNFQCDFTALNREKKIALIKDKKWIDEKEFRIVFTKDDESNLIFEDNNWFLSVKIRNIYLGVRFAENKVLEICDTNNINVTRMVLSTEKYELNVQKSKRRM